MFVFNETIKRVAVIGGGRWARVIAESLLQILPAWISLSIHSQRNISILEEWRSKISCEKKIDISSDWPELTDERDCAVIIVNAARDHLESVIRALYAGAPVLVEKPVAMTYVDVYNMRQLSLLNNTKLAAAHVCLFYRYLEKFVSMTALAGSIKKVYIRWADAKLESRYGETKQYDSSVPIYADVLPHVLPILNKLLIDQKANLEEVRVLGGGAHLVCDLVAGTSLCVFDLERNAKQRERYIDVIFDNQLQYKLDFSSEPGQIYDGKNWINGDEDWNIAPRPLKSMLHAFLQWILYDRYDNRLDIQEGLDVSEQIDKCRIMYDKKQLAWLNFEYSKSLTMISEDLKYALSELLQINSRLSEHQLQIKIEEFITGVYND